MVASTLRLPSDAQVPPSPVSCNRPRRLLAAQPALPLLAALAPQRRRAAQQQLVLSSLLKSYTLP